MRHFQRDVGNNSFLVVVLDLLQSASFLIFRSPSLWTCSRISLQIRNIVSVFQHFFFLSDCSWKFHFGDFLLLPSLVLEIYADFISTSLQSLCFEDFCFFADQFSFFFCVPDGIFSASCSNKYVVLFSGFPVSSINPICLLFYLQPLISRNPSYLQQ